MTRSGSNVAAKKPICPKCNGLGAKRDNTPSHKWETCKACKGTGYQRKGKK